MLEKTRNFWEKLTEYKKTWVQLEENLLSYAGRAKNCYVFIKRISSGMLPKMKDFSVQ